MQLCSECHGEKVMHYPIEVYWDGEWLGDVYTEPCPRCYGSGLEEFDCHEGCPPYEHFHDARNEICMLNEVPYPPWATIRP